MASPKSFGGERAFLLGGGEMAELVAQHDWASTSLGALETWPAALKVAISMILNSSTPMALLLGDEAITLYNDPYVELIGLRHPSTLGCKARESWPELAGLTDQAVAAARSGQRLSFRDLELTVLRKGVPEHVWMNIDCSPVRDENGVCLGLLAVTVEMTERVLAERKASLQFDQLRNLFDQAPGFICLLGGPPDYLVHYVNEAHKRLFGDRNAEGRPYGEVFGDIAKSGGLEIVLEAYASGQRYIGRGDLVFAPTPDGGRDERFVDVVLEPVKDQDGKVTGIYAEGFDVTPLVRSQHAEGETARRLSAAVAVAQLGTFDLAPKTREAKLDDRARKIFGFGPDEPLAVDDLIARIDSEDLRRLALEDAAAISAGQTRREVDYRICLPDGSVRHVRAVGDLIVGPVGQPLWSVGLLEDVTERRRAEQRQLMLMNELNHRVKNTLATVQSIASQTLRSATDLADARASFEARLLALAAAHDLLTVQSWHGARLDEVAAAGLAPFQAVYRPQVTCSGPPVWLTAPCALALTLALHELGTNAVKYGALSVPQGRVKLCWTLSQCELAVAWTEEGGPPVTPPARSGFGMRLLQRSLARELGGDVGLEFAPEGVRCEIRILVEGPDPGAEPKSAASGPDPPGRYWQPQSGPG